MGKILIIRFSSIGDIVLTTPVIRCLANQTESEIHFLTKKSFASVLAGNPYISKLWSTDGNDRVLVEQLRAEEFDWIFDMHKNSLSRHYCAQLDRPAIGFDKINVRKWLMVNLKVDLLPQKHLVERYFASLEPKGIHYDGLGLDYFLPDLIKEQSSALIPTKPFITIALGAAHATKQIPIAGIREICSQIDAPIVLLGGPKEKSLGDEISASFAHVVNTCGQFSLAESAFAVQKSRILVTPDTGMMHIGAALRKKMIVVWGNTIPQFGMYSFYPNGFNLATNYEVNGLNCRPCSKIGFKACPYGHFRCMLEQEYHRMAAEIEAVLGA